MQKGEIENVFYHYLLCVHFIYKTDTSLIRKRRAKAKKKTNASKKRIKPQNKKGKKGNDAQERNIKRPWLKKEKMKKKKK